MNFCTECGRRFAEPEDHFCIYCGAARAVAGQQVQEANPTVDTPALEQQPLSVPTGVATDGSAGRDSWLVPIGAIMLIMICGVAGIAIWVKRETPSKSSATSNGQSPRGEVPPSSEAQGTPSESVTHDPSLLACQQSLPNNRILRAGDTGNAVRALQWGLAALKYETYKGSGQLLSATGTYDQQTVEAVRRFQQKHGLGVNGSVDAGTWSTLNDQLRTWGSAHAC